MRKILFATVILSSLLSSTVFADVNPNRVLTCTNTAGTLAIPSCGGIAGCTATITANSTPVDYAVKRTRNSDGSFVFTTKTGALPKCTISLKKGNTTLKSVSCLKGLKNAPCKIQ